MSNRLVNRQSPAQDLIHRRRATGGGQPQGDGGVRLGIEIDEEDPASSCRQDCRKIDCGCGLAASAFLIGHRNDTHARPPSSLNNRRSPGTYECGTVVDPIYYI